MNAQARIEQETVENFASESDRKTKRGQFKSSTHFVDDSTDLSQLVADHFPCDVTESSEQKNLLLTGLHTCGDLAAQVLRMFLVHDDVRAVCQVGCCYHLMEERYSGDSSRGLCFSNQYVS